MLVGILQPGVADLFETVEPPRKVMYWEAGQPIAAWSLTVCRGYKGPSKPLPRSGF